MLYSKPFVVLATTVLTVASLAGGRPNIREGTPGIMTGAAGENLYAASGRKIDPCKVRALLKTAKTKSKDCDKDGLLRKDEEKVYKTNPYKKDSDKNGVLDGDEDYDQDGIDNEDEKDHLCRGVDTDGDGIADSDENDFGTNPKDSDTDNDGIVDGDDDANNNGIDDEDEDDDLNSCSKEDRDDDGGLATPAPTATARPGQTPAPTATPGGIPTPTRTPTRTPTPGSGGNSCDSGGNTSGFGIPSGYTGHRSAGSSLWSQSCQGCHGSLSGTNKRGSSYSSTYNSRNRADMLSVRSLLGNVQNSADITAALNCN